MAGTEKRTAEPYALVPHSFIIAARALNKRAIIGYLGLLAVAQAQARMGSEPGKLYLTGQQVREVCSIKCRQHITLILDELQKNKLIEIEKIPRNQKEFYEITVNDTRFRHGHFLGADTKMVSPENDNDLGADTKMVSPANQNGVTSVTKMVSPGFVRM